MEHWSKYALKYTWYNYILIVSRVLNTINYTCYAPKCVLEDNYVLSCCYDVLHPVYPCYLLRHVSPLISLMLPPCHLLLPPQMVLRIVIVIYHLLPSLAAMRPMMIFLLVIIGLLRMLYCCHGKRIHQTDSRKQLTYDPDHDDFREKKEEQRNETHVIHASKAGTNSCSVLYITLTGRVPIVCFRLQRPSESQTTLITN